MRTTAQYHSTTQARRLVVYARVSTDEQAEHGVSLAAQEARLPTFIEAHGDRCVASFNDAASGAVKPERRPGLASALALVSSGQADGIVVTKLDRISRSTIDTLQLLERAQREGVEHHLGRRAPRHEHRGRALCRRGVRGGGRDGARPHLGENTCGDEADRVGGARSFSALALRLPTRGCADPHRNAKGQPKQAHPGAARAADFEPNPAPSRAGQGGPRHRLELQAPWAQESSYEPRLVSRRHAGDLGHGHPRRTLTRSRRLHPIFGRRGNLPTPGGSLGKY